MTIVKESINGVIVHNFGTWDDMRTLVLKIWAAGGKATLHRVGARHGR